MISTDTPSSSVLEYGQIDLFEPDQDCQDCGQCMGCRLGPGALTECLGGNSVYHDHCYAKSLDLREITVESTPSLPQLCRSTPPSSPQLRSDIPASIHSTEDSTVALGSPVASRSETDSEPFIEPLIEQMIVSQLKQGRVPVEACQYYLADMPFAQFRTLTQNQLNQPARELASQIRFQYKNRLCARHSRIRKKKEFVVLRRAIHDLKTQVRAYEMERDQLRRQLRVAKEKQQTLLRRMRIAWANDPAKQQLLQRVLCETDQQPGAGEKP